MSPHQFLSILWARRWQALFIFGLTVMAGVAVALLTPPRHVAAALLLIDPARSELMASSAQGAQQKRTYLST